MDSIIQEISQSVLEWRNYRVMPTQLRRWAEHLRDVVQPQLDELAALKAQQQKRKAS